MVLVLEARQFTRQTLEGQQQHLDVLTKLQQHDGSSTSSSTADTGDRGWQATGESSMAARLGGCTCVLPCGAANTGAAAQAKACAGQQLRLFGSRCYSPSPLPAWTDLGRGLRVQVLRGGCVHCRKGKLQEQPADMHSQHEALAGAELLLN